jgi:hypothetical protein
MDDAKRFRLRFGRYRTPRFRYGAKVEDARRGRVKIVGITDAPIPWPIGMKRGGKSPVLYGALTRGPARVQSSRRALVGRVRADGDRLEKGSWRAHDHRGN